MNVIFYWLDCGGTQPMHPIKGELSEFVVKAGDAYVGAWRAYTRARDACCETLDVRLVYTKARKTLDVIWDTYIETVEAHEDEIEILYVLEHTEFPQNKMIPFPVIYD